MQVTHNSVEATQRRRRGISRSAPPSEHTRRQLRPSRPPSPSRKLQRQIAKCLCPAARWVH